MRKTLSVLIAILFFLLPTYLLRFQIGPLPSTVFEVLLGVTSVVWFFAVVFAERRAIWQGVKNFKRNHPDLWLAIELFLIGATIGVIVSVNTRVALGEWKAFYVEPVLLFFIVITTIREKREIERIFFALLLSGFLTSLLTIYQHSTGWLVPHAFWANRNTYRVTGWYGFPNAVGFALAPLVPIALYLLKEKKEWWIRLLVAISIPCFILGIWFAKSTGGLIGVTAGLGVLLLFYKKTRLPAIALGLISLAVLLFVVPSTNSIRQELLMQDRSGQLRLNMWAETTEFLIDRPIVGAGLASYQTLIRPYRIDKWVEVFHHPHNLLLTMWVNVGFIGLVGFLLLVVWYYRVLHMQDKKTPLVMVLISMMTVMLTIGLVDSPYIKNDTSMFFWLLPALALILSRDRDTV